MRKCISLSGAALTLGILITPSPAQSSSAIRVGVPQLAPCSIHDGEQFSGSVYQLWQAASADLPVRHSIKSIASLQKGIQELRNKSIDILVTCLAITPERASSIEYSFPVMEDGIRLLQKKKNATALDYAKSLVFNEVASLSIVTLIACSLLFLVALHFNEQGSCSVISRQDFPKKATTILRTAASFIAGSSIQNEAQKTSSIPPWTVAGITRACLIALLTAGITKGLVSETNPVKFAPVAKRDNWHDPHKRYGVIEGSAEEEFLKIFEEKMPGDYRFVAGFPNT